MVSWPIRVSRFMGSRFHPRSVMCVCVCAGVCVWVFLIEADSLQLRIIYRGYIRSCPLSCVVRSSDCLPCHGLWFPSVPASWFRDSCSLPFPGLYHRTLGCPLFPCATCPLPTESSTLFPQFHLSNVFVNKPFLFPLLESSSLFLTEGSDHSMDSAEARGFQELLANNNACMDQQEENMLNTGRAVRALVAQVSELTTQLQLLRSPAAPPTPPILPVPGNNNPQHEPRLPTPEVYAGDPNLCRAFLTKCSLFFSLQPQTFTTEASKVALVLTLLSGKAALWGTAVCGRIAIHVVPRSAHFPWR